MKKRNEELHNDPWDPDYYETGSTKPPKNRGGLVAFLLVLVILLGGLCSALGLLNVHLLMQLAQTEENPNTLSVFEKETDNPGDGTLSDGGTDFNPLGLRGQTVSDFDRRFYELPYGVLVLGVCDGRGADSAGIRCGDIITHLGGRRVSSGEELLQALEDCTPGQAVQVEFYRQQTGDQRSVSVTLSQEEE